MWHISAISNVRDEVSRYLKRPSAVTIEIIYKLIMETDVEGIDMPNVFRLLL